MKDADHSKLLRDAAWCLLGAAQEAYRLTVHAEGAKELFDARKAVADDLHKASYAAAPNPASRLNLWR